jgi:hypothetical protein
MRLHQSVQTRDSLAPLKHEQHSKTQKHTTTPSAMNAMSSSNAHPQTACAGG